MCSLDCESGPSWEDASENFNLASLLDVTELTVSLNAMYMPDTQVIYFQLEFNYFPIGI